MATFTYPVSYNSGESTSARLKGVTFGDGYQQRVGDGINMLVRTWDVVFGQRDPTEAQAIVDFFAARANVNGQFESFDWTPPSGAAGTWVCASWKRTPNASNSHTVMATFSEVFE